MQNAGKTDGGESTALVEFIATNTRKLMRAGRRLAALTRAEMSVLMDDGHSFRSAPRLLIQGVPERSLFGRELGPAIQKTIRRQVSGRRLEKASAAARHHRDAACHNSRSIAGGSPRGANCRTRDRLGDRQPISRAALRRCATAMTCRR